MNVERYSYNSNTWVQIINAILYDIKILKLSWNT